MLATTDALSPLLRRRSPGDVEAQAPRFAPRIVNMASLTGKLNKYSAELTRQFRAAQTVEQANALMRRYLDSLRRGTLIEDGWPPDSPYAVSKAGVVALTRALARERAGDGRDVLVNCCCPGYVKTDLTGGRGRRSPDEGAATPVMLALDDLRGRSGGFWTNGEEIDW